MTFHLLLLFYCSMWSCGVSIWRVCTFPPGQHQAREILQHCGYTGQCWSGAHCPLYLQVSCPDTQLLTVDEKVIKTFITDAFTVHWKAFITLLLGAKVWPCYIENRVVKNSVIMYFAILGAKVWPCYNENRVVMNSVIMALQCTSVAIFHPSLS